VFLNRLVVGHTHNSIDQMFIAFRKTMRKKNVRDLVEFVNEVRAGYPGDGTRPRIVALERTLNWDAWLGPHQVKDLHGHMKPLGMHFKRGADGVVGFEYKALPAQDSAWLGENARENGPLVRVLQSIPSGHPEVLPLDWQPSEKLVKSMKTAARFLTPAQLDWYATVMQDGSLGLTLDDLDSKTGPRIPPGVVGQPATVRIGSASASLDSVRYYPSKFWEIPKESVIAYEEKLQLPPLVGFSYAMRQYIVKNFRNIFVHVCQAPSEPLNVNNRPRPKAARKRSGAPASTDVDARARQRQRTRAPSDDVLMEIKESISAAVDPDFVGSDHHDLPVAGSTARLTRSKGVRFQFTKTLLTRGIGTGQVVKLSPEREAVGEAEEESDKEYSESDEEISQEEAESNEIAEEETESDEETQDDQKLSIEQLSIGKRLSYPGPQLLRW